METKNYEKLNGEIEQQLTILLTPLNNKKLETIVEDYDRCKVLIEEDIDKLIRVMFPTGISNKNENTLRRNKLFQVALQSDENFFRLHTYAKVATEILANRESQIIHIDE